MRPTKCSEFLKTCSPNALLAWLLVAWWGANVVFAAFTGLVDDEAYYWLFSQHLDWGYFDHPPMVALLIWLTSWIPGELGVRLAATMLQPGCLYLLWTLLRGPQPTRRDAWRFFLVCFSLPLLQLYGILALPDAPLAFFTVLFLWTYVRYCDRPTAANATFMAAAMALLVYSKYHGVLVILLTLFSNPRLLRHWRTYYAGLLALVFFMPHLWWQYQHDFVSFQYHLAGRVGDGGFKWGQVAGYLAAFAAIANPAWAAFYLRGCGRRTTQPLRAALTSIFWGFFVFFLLSSLRDKTQPQWLLPTVFPMAAFLFSAVRETPRKRLFNWVGVGSFLLFLGVRAAAVFNPFNFQGQLWNNREDNEAIAALADGRPVIFTNDYTSAAKYAFYTGNPSYGQSVFFSRCSQWQYYNLDDRYFSHPGTDAVIAVSETPDASAIALPGGGEFRYVTMNNYRPIRRVRVEPAAPIRSRIDEGDSLEVVLHVSNPYPYDLVPTDSVPLLVTLFWRVSQHDQPESLCPIGAVLPARSTTLLRCRFAVPSGLPAGDYGFGFSLRYQPYRSVLSSSSHLMSVSRSNSGITLVQQQ